MAPGQHFTPPALVDHVLHLAGAAALADGSRVLEPACGEGAFLLGLARCLRRRLAHMEVLAFEIDPSAAETARRAFARALEEEAGLGRRAAAARARRSVVVGDFLASGIWDEGRFDLAVGNPPFLEAKQMPKAMKAALRREHERWTRGAFDLFVPFVGRAAEAVGAEGRLAFVLPNKVCIARYARSLRDLLLEAFPLTALTDLSHSRAFEAASVYPVVVAAARGETTNRVAIGLGQRQGGTLHFRRVGSLPRAAFQDAPDRVFFTLPEEETTRADVEALLDPPLRLGELLRIRWTVSFHRAGLRDRYLFPRRPDSPHALPLLGAGRYQGNRDVERYRIAWRGWWIDYDQSRARADGNPLPDPRLFRAPKLVICQNALRPRAALDTVGYALKDTFFAAHPTPAARRLGVSLEALLAVLNSDLVHRWYRSVFGMTQVRGGYLHFLVGYLGHVPLPPPQRLRGPSWRRLVRARSEASGAPAERLDARIEAAVREAFNLPQG